MGWASKWSWACGRPELERRATCRSGGNVERREGELSRGSGGR